MSRFNKVVAAALAGLVIVSCTGIEEQNPTSLGTIYDTEALLESAVCGVVAGFGEGSCGVSGESLEAFGCASGLIHWGVRGTSTFSKPMYESCLHFTQYSTNGWNGYYFRQLYVPVTRANSLIEGLADSPVDEAFKTEIEAEARFYRAVAYYWIVRTWGDCPLRLEVDDEKTATDCPRSPYYKVYAQIVSDLEFAEANMRGPARVKQVSPTMARPNRFAATAYLCDVYTTIGSLLASPDDNFWDNSKPGRKPDFSDIGLDGTDMAAACRGAYTKALEYAGKLIPESGRTDPECPYSLVEKHGDLFNFSDSFSRNGYSAYMNPEQIFVLSSTVSGGVNCRYAQYQLPNYPAGTSATIYNAQYGRIRPTRWVFQKWCETYPGDLSSVPTIWASSTDPRLDNTFYYGKMKYCNGSGVLSIYPSATTAQDKEKSYPYFKKVASERYNVNVSDADIYMMRLAVIYFDAAEACAVLGDEASARKYVGYIHARARHSVADGEADALQPDWTGRNFPTTDDLLTAIFWERIYELYGENHEYFETHRHGARWLIRNVCIPKNEFLRRPIECELCKYAYPDTASFKYPEKWTDDPDTPGSDVYMIRKGLLAAFPQSEMLYNTAISETDNQNDYTF